jgi:hypothetical protein
MHPTPIVRGAVVGALLALACRSTSEAPAPSQHPGQKDAITQAEIRTVLSRSSTAYDIVRQLRPAMLLRRTVTGVEPTPSMMAKELPGAHVHVDDVRVGPFDILSTIPAAAVASIEWLSATDASTRFGNGHTAGVIVVTTFGGRW